MKSINFALLRAFHAVASQGSFTAAARLMRVTQPTVSQQIKLLEETCAVRLLDRSRRGVRVTELGAELFVITRRLFAAEQEATELLTGVTRLVGGRLAVGADSPFHVMKLISAFQQEHPGPEIALSVGNSTTILAALLSTRLDVAVIADLPGDARLFAIPLRRDPVLAMLPAGHRLAGLGSVTLADMARERLILREKGSVTRAVVERALADREIMPGAVMEIESREAVREAVAGGLGLGFVSAAETMPDPRIALLPVAGAQLEIDEFVVCLRERRRLAIVRAFLQTAEQAALSQSAKAASGAKASF
jgi:aminoethylphosphonate catabolism LysR family transcriptional regulator